MKKIIKSLAVLLLLGSTFGTSNITEVNAARLPVEWLEQRQEIEEYDYSFAVLGDTQIVSQNFPDSMHSMYKWIVDNKEEKNIQFAFGLGDITEGDADWEWANDKVAVDQLQTANIPYSLVRGNHDTSVKFYNTFGTEEYMGQFLGFYKENNLNSCYRTLTVGRTNFLLLTLDYGADDQELTWAGNVIERFPNHKVIITTHCFLDEKGEHINDSHGTAPSTHNDDDKSTKDYNNGVDMWDKLFSQYGNIVLIMAGHINSPDIPVRQDVGVHGNVVTQMLINPQTEFDVDVDGGCAMVCMLYFDEDFSNIQVEYYSTIRNQYAKISKTKLDLSRSGNSAHTLTIKNNNTYHWEECACGRKMVEELEEHTFSKSCASKCDTCNFTRTTTHTYDSVGYDETSHYKECSGCNEKDVSSIKPHIYDASCDPTCNMCGYVRNVEHDLSIHHKDTEYHYDECSVCGSELNKQAHVYDHDCDTTCNICSYERYISHDFSILVENDEGTFKECSICGLQKEIRKPNNSLPIIIGCSIGGLILIGGIVAIVLINKKKKF